MAEMVVASRDEIPPGSRKMVEVNGRQVYVFNIQGQYFAVLNQCADQGGPVCEGGLFPNIRADVLPGRVVREYLADEGYILACPWHGWEYDIRSGTCLWNRSHHLRTYRVSEDAEGNVRLNV